MSEYWMLNIKPMLAGRNRTLIGTYYLSHKDEEDYVQADKNKLKIYWQVSNQNNI